MQCPLFLAGLLACGTAPPRHSPVGPAPRAPTARAAPPAVPDLLHVHALSLSPDIPAMKTAMAGVLAAWRQCATAAEKGCGYQVIYLEQDRHTQTYSLGWYVDKLDGPVETCITQHAEELTLTPEVPIPHGYEVAFAVAPSSEELTRCAAGLAEEASPFF